jgi:hypothetical protein
MKPTKFLITLVLILLIAGTQVRLFGGVKTNNTNIGTNPYKDMEANYDDGYANVNPNYSDQAMNYPGQTGDVAVDPAEAVGTVDNGIANYYGSNVVVAGQYYHDYNGWSGTAPPGTMIPIGTILEEIPSSAVPVMVNGARYYYQNSVFLAEVYDGSAIVYQVVPAPVGAVVTMLPYGCMPQLYNGNSFYICGNTYYKQVAGGYQIVRALN